MEEWSLAFNDSSTHRGGGQKLCHMLLMHLHLPRLQIWILLYQEQRRVWALIIGLISTLKMGIRRLRVKGDSKLIIKRINGEIALKEIIFVPYRTVFQRLIKSFKEIRFENTSPMHNRHCWLDIFYHSISTSTERGEHIFLKTRALFCRFFKILVNHIEEKPLIIPSLR